MEICYTHSEREVSNNSKGSFIHVQQTEQKESFLYVKRFLVVGSGGRVYRDMLIQADSDCFDFIKTISACEKVIVNKDL